MVTAGQVDRAVNDFLTDTCMDSAHLIEVDGFPHTEFVQRVMSVSGSALGESISLHYRRQFAEEYAAFYVKNVRRDTTSGRRW